MARLIEFSRRSTVQLQKILEFYDERNGNDAYSRRLLKSLLSDLQQKAMTHTASRLRRDGSQWVLALSEPSMWLIIRRITGANNNQIVRVKGINLIVECEDFDSDKSGNKEAKRHYLKDYWIPAANNLKIYGTWDLLEVRDIDQLESEILKKVG